MKSLRPFFHFFGGKFRIALKYPVPLYATIVEPFSGAAGYATRHFQKKVLLIEKDPAIAALWKFLIRVKSREVLRIPLVKSLDERPLVEEWRLLVGFWLASGFTGPRKQVSKRSLTRPNTVWGEVIRQRIASQVPHIKHWRIREGDFLKMDFSMTATWFVDPPYIDKGRAYVCSSREVDFQKLSSQVRKLKGQVIVCENQGATWLPFKPFVQTHGNAQRKSQEVIWYRSQRKS